MGSGRPPEGVEHVERLDGPQELKRRLRLILETLVGRLSVSEACEQLGVSASRLHELRRQALSGALGALMPRPPGRPAAAASGASSREQELEARIRELEVDLQAALVRTELALAMPQLFRGGGKKNRRRRSRRSPARRPGPGASG